MPQTILVHRLISEDFELSGGGFLPVNNQTGVGVNVQVNIIAVMFAGHEVRHITVVSAYSLSILTERSTKQVATLG